MSYYAMDTDGVQTTGRGIHGLEPQAGSAVNGVLDSYTAGAGAVHHPVVRAAMHGYHDTHQAGHRKFPDAVAGLGASVARGGATIADGNNEVTNVQKAAYAGAEALRRDVNLPIDGTGVAGAGAGAAPAAAAPASAGAPGVAGASASGVPMDNPLIKQPGSGRDAPTDPWTPPPDLSEGGHGPDPWPVDQPVVAPPGIPPTDNIVEPWPADKPVVAPPGIPPIDNIIDPRQYAEPM